MSENTTTELIGIEQAAKELDITTRALRYHCKQGRVGSQPNGPGTGWVFTRSDLDAFKQQSRKPGPKPASREEE